MISLTVWSQVFGATPFTGSTPQDIFRKAVSDPLEFPKDSKNYTNSWKDFISKLLCKTTSFRLSAEKALKHKWIHEPGSTTNLITSSSSYIQSLRAYNGGNKLQHILFNAILNELSDDQQEILDEGLIGMQRELSRCTTNHVMDYMLLNTWIQDLPGRDEQWKKQRVNQLIKHQSSRNVISPKFNPHIFSPNNNNKIFIKSKIVKAPKSIVPDSSDEQLSTAMEQLESLRSCGPEQNTGSYIAYIDAAISRAMERTKEESRSPIALTGNLPNDDEFPSISGSAMDIGSRPLTLMSPTNNADEAIKRTATDDEVELRRISPNRLRGIMSKSNKKYNVEEIIENLKDETGHIPLDQIPLYTETVKSLSEEWMGRGLPIHHDISGFGEMIPMVIIVNIYEKLS